MKEIRVFVSAETTDADPDDRSIIPFRLMVPEVKEVNKKSLAEMISDLGDLWGDIHVYFNPRPGTLEHTIYGAMDWTDAKVLKYEIGSPDLDHMHLWFTFGRQRMREIEHLVVMSDRDSVTYAKTMKPEDWLSFTDEELLRSPVFMFYYAKDVCKGRLPDHLDSAMNMMSFNMPDNAFVKRYFATKRYRVRCGKSLLKKKEAANA